MRAAVRKILAAIEIARLSAAFGAIANVWVMVLLARTDSNLADLPVATRPIWQALGAGALVAVGFLAFGAALNDFLDAKHDRAFAPDRPLPAGSIKPRRAVQIAFVALCAGIVGALAFGAEAVIVALGLGAVVIVYDAFAKHVPALGFALAGVATALSMLVPCAETKTLMPIWVALGQTMAVGALAYVLGEKRPVLSRRAIVLGAVGWVVLSTALLGLEWVRNGGALHAELSNPQVLAIPAATALLGAALGLWKLRHARGARASERILRYGSLWKSLVAASWLVAAGLPREGAAIAAVAVAIFLAVALARELGPQVADPVSWRSS